MTLYDVIIRHPFRRHLLRPESWHGVRHVKTSRLCPLAVAAHWRVAHRAHACKWNSACGLDAQPGAGLQQSRQSLLEVRVVMLKVEEGQRGRRLCPGTTRLLVSNEGIY